jgi:hypothetical protein
MMKGEDAGMGVIVGAAVGSSVGIGAAGAEQDANKTASRLRRRRRRSILFEGQVQAMRQRIHCFRDQAVKIRIGILKEFRRDRTELHAKLVFNPVPEGNRAIGTPGGDQLQHNGPQDMIWSDKLVERISTSGEGVGILSELEQGVFTLEEFYKIICRFQAIGISIGMPPPDQGMLIRLAAPMFSISGDWS